MVEKFLENIVVELNENCMNKESKTFVQWILTDINLDINKCRKHCNIDSGYMWNEVKICESCDKILHKNLDRFTKSNIDIIFDNMILEQKIDKQNTEIEVLKVQYDYLKSMNTIMEDKLNFLHKSINNIKTDINDININITENQNNIKNNNIITENLLQTYEINIKNLENRFDDFINNINNIIDEEINNNNININNNNNIDNQLKKLENRFDDFTNNINNIIDKQINNNNNIKKNNKIIDKQVEYQDFDNKKININKINDNKINDNKIIDNKIIDNKNIIKLKANIKIFDKCKVGGIGYILSVNTISHGNVKRGYTYQSKSNENLLFKIKDFDNNFCPLEFNYPDSNIYIIPDFIQGHCKDIELYDEFICIKSD